MEVVEEQLEEREKIGKALGMSDEEVIGEVMIGGVLVVGTVIVPNLTWRMRKTFLLSAQSVHDDLIPFIMGVAIKSHNLYTEFL